MAAETVNLASPAPAVSETTKNAASQKKPRAPRIPAAHPSYLQMTVEAISALKDRTGSSHPAITKCIEDKYKGVLPSNFKKLLFIQLKKFSKSGKLVQIKNSYKLSKELKKPAKKPSAVNKAAPKSGETKKVVKKTCFKAISGETEKKVVKKKPSLSKSSDTAKQIVKKAVATKVSGTGKPAKPVTIKASKPAKKAVTPAKRVAAASKKATSKPKTGAAAAKKPKAAAPAKKPVKANAPAAKKLAKTA